MKYIRTHCEILEVKNEMVFVDKGWLSIKDLKHYIVAEADTIEELIDGISSIPSTVEGDLSEIKGEIAKAHDKKQEELNTEAYNTVKNTPGVTSVNGG